MAASHMETVAASNYDAPVADNSGKKVCGIDMEYARSIYGMTKLAQVLLSLLAFFLVAFVAAKSPRAILFSIVTFFAFFFATILFLAFATSLHKNVKKINWYVMDLAVSGIGALVLFTFSSLTVASPLKPVVLVSGVVGFLDMIAFIVATFFAFKRYRENKQRLARQPEYQVDY
ncbi:CKLF-like MARVEL transmembrane domain-containing protein 4 [Holothuria leucospilota]|uniref:CKLF-like MARVEL transmembrane domain-containing protein 4 n=1 Tax=Holothuria leucospilota TaxID=206669 RepID=A0A9Q1CCG9_HOLLE|nr:CKLF-like MARVEL transmembrane domain-containing protein 4 [Holothuria leucospilota]